MTEESLSAAEPTFIQKLAAEVIGTFILVFLGCGSVVAIIAGATHAGPRNALWGLEVAAVGLAFGIAVVIGAYTFGRISGGHFNPAVTLGVASAGRISWKDAGAYIGAQFVGATLGALVLFLVALSSGYNSWSDGGLAANAWGDGAGTGLIGAILAELVLTFIFVFVILGVTDKRAGTNATAAPLAIGFSLAAIHFVGIPLTGTSVNPARSFGPALFSGTDALVDLPVFLIIPAVGGALAGFVYPLLFNKDGSEIPGAGLAFGGDNLTPAPSFQSWDSQAAAPAAPAAAATPPAPAAPAAPAADPAPAAPETSDRTIVSGGAGNGGQPAWQQPTQTTEGDLPVYEQDGWRWDYAKQEWVPIEQ
ncbi:MIP/aquaporin family protein [Nocardioides sp. NPDC059952]|uniref:MIP/aquaporin family protein n=1 Tax=Nocardioides sp. NPDC059952 TaxID=3347014 RepID=UPI003660DA43